MHYQKIKLISGNAVAISQFQTNETKKPLVPALNSKPDLKKATKEEKKDASNKQI